MRLNIMNTKLNENEMPYIIKEKAVNYNFDYKKSANSPKLIVEMMNSLFDLYNKLEEYLYLISMDCVHKPLAFFEISHGAVDRTVASTREIMIKALLSGAVKIVLVHNHPSGGSQTVRRGLQDYTKDIACCRNPRYKIVRSYHNRQRKLFEFQGVWLV